MRGADRASGPGIGGLLWCIPGRHVLFAPNSLAAAMIGAPDSVTSWTRSSSGGDAPRPDSEEVGCSTFVLSPGFVVYALVGLAAIYTIFLLSLARVAVDPVGLGPLYIATLLLTVAPPLQAWIEAATNSP